jgi:peptide/nickel transport system permease protein
LLGLIARRVGHALVAFAGITFVVFLLVRIAPGDPVDRYLGGLQARHATPELETQLRREMGLDKPFVSQYVGWLKRAATLDFGRSFIDRRPVRERIGQRLPATLALNMSALVLALAIAIPVALLSAARPEGPFDRAARLVLLFLYAVPSFLGALALLDLFAVRLGWLPLLGPGIEVESFFGVVRHAALPVIALAYGQVALFSRFTRSALIESLGQDFVTAARARGLSWWEILTRHGLRTSLIPLVSLMSVVVPSLLSGSVIIERIFQWNGLGNLFFDAVVARDYPTVMGLAILTACLTLAASVAADILYAVLDPRVRESAV